MLSLLAIAHVLGSLLMVFSATFLLPMGWSIAEGDGTFPSFLAAAALTLGVGTALWLAGRGHGRELQPRDGCVLVVSGWVSMAALGAVPLMMELPGLSFTDAFFESVSGLTATGATVLTGLDTIPHGVNVWRHALSWYGGMGIIVLAVAILPLIGVGGMQLFKAETPGPMKEGRLAPRIAQVARYLWLVYVGLTALCVLALRAAGMDWYDAVCHAFSAVSLGGFSTRDASVAAFDSPAIEAVLMAFMLIAVLNFSTHFTALRQRSPRAYLRDPEALPVLGLILGSCLLLAAFLHEQGIYEDYGAALRFASFNVISLATTTGLISADYDAWPIFASMWLLFLCAVSSSAGSTGGGIKMIRALLLVKQARRELVRLVHPRAINPLSLGGALVDNKVIFAVLGFMLLYGFTLAVVAFALLATGLDLTTAVTATIASVNNTGPGLARVGPTQTYAFLSDFQTWLLAFAMLAGRLELLTVFALFLPSFWRR